MKLFFDFKANKFRLLPTLLKCYNPNAKKIKKLSSWIGEIHVHSRDIDRYEIYHIESKDRKTITYWLVEHNILSGTGKAGSGINTIELIPQYQVDLVQQDKTNPEYWIVKRTGIKATSKIL